MNVRSALKWRIGAWRSVHRSPVRRPRLWPLLLFLSGLMGAAAPLVWLGMPAYEEQQALRLSLESVKREREAARARLELSSDRLNRLQAQVTSLPQVEPVGEAADALMPQQLALAHALHLEQFRWVSREGGSAPRAAGASSATPDHWVVQVRGPYRSLLAYLSALEQSGPAWSLKQLQLTAGRSGKHRLRVMLVPLPSSRWTSARSVPTAMSTRMGDPFGLPVEPMVSRPQAPEGSGSMALEPASAPPAVRTSAPTGSPQPEPPPPRDPWADLPQAWRMELERERAPLESLPLTQFFFAGTLRQGQTWRALMRVGSVVHSVAVGDYLGPDLGRVQSVTETGLELREIRRDASGRWIEQLRRWPVGGSP